MNTYSHPLITFIPDPRAPVAQGIEHCPPEAGAQVRFLSGARDVNHLKYGNLFEYLLVYICSNRENRPLARIVRSTIDRVLKGVEPWIGDINLHVAMKTPNSSSP